jgi:hypothetical protein
MSRLLVRFPRRHPGRPRADRLGNTRQRIGPHIRRSAFREMIMKLLWEAPNHTLPSREVRRILGQHLRSRFTPVDLSRRASGPLWVNEMQWARKQLVMAGIMEGVEVSGHSTWMLSRKGIAEARALFAD